jgi:serine O-acetyltransferase
MPDVIGPTMTDAPVSDPVVGHGQPARASGERSAGDSCDRHASPSSPGRRRYGTLRPLRPWRKTQAGVAHLLVWLSDQRPVIDADVARWNALACHGLDLTDPLGWLYARMPEFRSVLYYRLERGRGRLAAKIMARVLPGQVACFLKTDDVGPGLFLQHGFATVVLARSIGADCWINQQVTIGHTDWRSESKPVIGDRVTIFAGAQVIGEITIGDDVVIGANAVVRKSVPPRCVVAGVPARIVWRDGQRVSQHWSVSP